MDSPKRLLLGNADYIGHTSSEGAQGQDGLREAGWIVTYAGKAKGGHVQDVPAALAEHDPDIVLVSDPRDFTPGVGAFVTWAEWRNVEALRDHRALKLVVLKDAGTAIDFQRRFAERIGADALVTYYNRPAVCAASGGWAAEYPLVRTHHTVDALEVWAAWNDWEDCGARPVAAFISGALNRDVYPLRERLWNEPWLDRLKHPGYNNRVRATPVYLDHLACYRVSVCTASRFNFELRKIVESLAMGCAVVTNWEWPDPTPEGETLPIWWNDIIHVRSDEPTDTIRDIVAEAVAQWNLADAIDRAGRMCARYDYRVEGRRLDRAITDLWRSRQCPSK